jgi:hypothetical protein
MKASGLWIFGIGLAALAHSGRINAEVVFRMQDFGTTAQVVVDGLIEHAWDAAPIADHFVEYRPREGVPATVRTEVRFGRDADAFYVAAKMFDPDMSQLRSGFARRDGYANEQDWFQIIIDPIGTRRVGQMIYVNPHGVIWDGLYNDDAGTFNTSADFDVQVATQLLSDSWVVEMRIPFSEVRYASREGDNWNLLVRRSTPRAERHAMAIPAIPSGSCFVCFAGAIRGLGHLPEPTKLDFNPQVVALSRGEGGDVNHLEWSSNLEPALEMKYRISPSTVLDATLNPDFSQVELDTPQLSSNQQFAVSFQEKRPFFLEGLDILDSPLLAIYTRSITDPAWGVRATHRGRWDAVFLTTEDDGGGLVVLPGAIDTDFALQNFSSQATIARTRVPLGPVTLGGLLTDRRTSDGYNTVAGPDLTWLVSPQSLVRLQWLSQTKGGAGYPGVDGDDGVRSGSALSFDWQYESRHWGYALALQQLDEDFRADNGFIPQVGIRKLDAELAYKFRDLPLVSLLAPYVKHDLREDLDGTIVNQAPRAGVEAELPRNTALVLEWRPNEQARVRPDSPLRSAQQAYVMLTSSPAPRIPAVSFEVTIGEAIDFDMDRVGRGETVAASVLLRPTARIEIEPRIDLTTIRTDAQDVMPAQEVFESAAQLLGTVHLSPRDRFRLILQHVEVERKDTEANSHSTDSGRFVDSLLYTHERSLASRIYAGVTYAHSDSIDPLPTDEVIEFFVKIQAGFSPGSGFRW